MATLAGWQQMGSVGTHPRRRRPGIYGARQRCVEKHGQPVPAVPREFPTRRSTPAATCFHPRSQPAQVRRTARVHTIFDFPRDSAKASPMEEAS